MKTPVVMIVYNRPDLTQQVFDIVKGIKPHSLYIIADGPKGNGDQEACTATTHIFRQVDWHCDIHTNFAERNLGCAERVISGLEWLFDAVDEAIILEDDCLVHPNFFKFADELLDKYRFDRRIGTIQAFNCNAESPGPFSYHFSSIPRIWGWATWRDVWMQYDRRMMKWPEIKTYGYINEVMSPKKAAEYSYYFDDTCHGGFQGTWDWQWIYLHFFNNWLSIVPTQNLVRNIGFGPRATHTQDPHQGDGHPPVGNVYFPLKHPPCIVPIRSYDT